jgi:hypothetical protein
MNIIIIVIIIIIILIILLILLPKNTDNFINSYSQINQDIEALEFLNYKNNVIIGSTDLKISKHICFFYLEHRIKYINRIIEECNIYPYLTDIFIHTNNGNLTDSVFIKYNNGKINIIVHKTFKDDNPFYLSWKCRELLKTQVELYDIFIYIEDDILIFKDTLNYWLKYKDMCINNNYNLGFIRIEINEKDEIYWVDSPNRQIFSSITYIENQPFILNNVQTYCASWIYDKSEFIRWINSSYWNIENIKSLEQDLIREVSAIGFSNEGYKGTIIPIENFNKLNKNCIVHHLDNKYIKDITTSFGKLNFNNSLILQ